MYTNSHTPHYIDLFEKNHPKYRNYFKLVPEKRYFNYERTKNRKKEKEIS